VGQNSWLFGLWESRILTLIPKCVFYSIPPSNFLMPIARPAIQLNSETIYLETTSDPLPALAPVSCFCNWSCYPHNHEE